MAAKLRTYPAPAPLGKAYDDLRHSHLALSCLIGLLDGHPPGAQIAADDFAVTLRILLDKMEQGMDKLQAHL